MDSKSKPLRGISVFIALTALSAVAAASGPRDAMVQSPTFKQPERGSLVGGLAKFSIGAEDVSRGSFSLGLPIEVPSERGGLLAPILPSYAPENGISEWGVGWGAGSSISRFRLTGDLDYQTDGFTSPWGRLVLGSDGFYYPIGMQLPVRIERRTDGWIATEPNGTRREFKRVVQTPEGPYAWYLTRVETVFGDAAEVVYVTSAGGRPFIDLVRYGNRETPDTYRLDFEYEALPAPLLDFRSGHPLLLDRRVKGIAAWAREGGSGPYRARWRHDITYRDTAFGPGFHLDTVMRTFASGESEPPVTYDYDLPEQTTPVGLSYPAGDLEEAPGLEDYLVATDDADGVQPDRAATTDLDDDGLSDLEHGADFTLYRQSAEGTFAPEALAPPPSDADPACRPPDSIFNDPRTLVRMAGATAPLQVLVLEAMSSSTRVRVCDRAGGVAFSADVPGLWTLGVNMKVVDLNRDERPDLLLVDSGTYTVLENTSGDGCGPSGGGCQPFGFQAHPPVALTYMNGFPFTPSATWSHDMNGDGNPDLVQRTADRMSIWYGRGRFRFDDTERQLAVLSRDGAELFNLDDWEVSWVDANKDGLVDAVMTFEREPSLFINEGDHFQEVVAPVLEESIQLGLGTPVVGDLRGLGDSDLYFIGEAVSASALTTPSTGLMVAADDGKGTEVGFAYGRAEAVPGLRQRPSLLTSLTVTTAGYEPVEYTYAYGAPRMHTLGHFLVGFGSVETTGPKSRERVEFYNDDQIAAQVETSRTFDERTPGLMRFSRATYEEALHAGVRVRRSQTGRSGWCAGSDVDACLAGGLAAAFETTEVLEYQRGVCPTRERTTTRQGQLVTESVLASPVGLASALHCVVSAQSWTGTHADAARNFRHEDRFTLDDFGQVTRVEQLGDGAALVLQDVAYDPVTHRLASIAAPGQGVQTFTFDPDTGQLDSTTGADGVVASVANRSGATDALLELVGNHGPGGVLVSSYRYDGMERLERSWTDFGGSSATEPLASIEYQFPTSDFPALVQVSKLLDAASHTRQASAVWSYPDGGALTSAVRIPGRWVFGGVSAASRTELRTTNLRRAPLADGADVAMQTYASLLADTTPLGEALSSTFGRQVSSVETVQQGVERRIATTPSVADGLLVTSVRENQSLETRSAVDASGRLVWVHDQVGATTAYDHDVLGRLVGVTLPDGARHRLTFDALGRPARVTRDGVGSVTYAYEPGTGRLHHKEYIDADGEVERTVELRYDAIGRVIERTHVKAASGDELRFHFRYDGDVGGGAVVGGQKGYTTQVEGPAYTATTVRNPDGSEARSSLVLAGWMKVDVENLYYAGGALRESHRTITRLADGVVVDDVTTGHHYDAFGRLHSLSLAGADLAVMHYDDEGRLAWVDVAGGQRIDHFYDPVTHRQRGYTQHMSDAEGDWQTGVDWNLDARGLISRETMTVGDESRARTYGYDTRGFLERSQDADELSTYTYTASGLADQVSDHEGTRSVFRGAARTLTVAGTPYTYDGSGRVIARGDAALSYGPDGQLAAVQLGGRALAYHHDADGNRILKLENGVPVAAYLRGGYLTDDGFIDPVEIGGRLVGVLEDGALRLLATDPRGTLLADRDGTPRFATPYGMRNGRPDLAAALDYVEKAYDADLESVRMGVRDYDPLLGQFWSPDPLYLETIDKCAESPVDCNLFSYARNNPVSFVDPTGTDSLITGPSDPADVGNKKLRAEFRKAYPKLENAGADMVHGPHPEGIMTQTGVRVPSSPGGRLPARIHYFSKSAAFAAYQGYINYAELLEAGFGNRALDMSLQRGTPFVPDYDLDLVQFVRWSQRSVYARNGVMLAVGFGEAAALGFITSARQTVWKRRPTDRGNFIEADLAATEYRNWYHIGAERNGYFPIIDFQKGNTVVSLKSADTATANWLGGLKTEMDTFAGRGIFVDGKPATKVLDLRVPPGGTAAAEPAVTYGQARGLTVTVKEYGQ
jgi:RHS repeat-associated protein